MQDGSWLPQDHADFKAAAHKGWADARETISRMLAHSAPGLGVDLPPRLLVPDQSTVEGKTATKLKTPTPPAGAREVALLITHVWKEAVHRASLVRHFAGKTKPESDSATLGVTEAESVARVLREFARLEYLLDCAAHLEATYPAAQDLIYAAEHECHRWNGSIGGATQIAVRYVFDWTWDRCWSVALDACEDPEDRRTILNAIDTEFPPFERLDLHLKNLAPVLLAASFPEPQDGAEQILEMLTRLYREIRLQGQPTSPKTSADTEDIEIEVARQVLRKWRANESTRWRVVKALRHHPSAGVDQQSLLKVCHQDTLNLMEEAKVIALSMAPKPGGTLPVKTWNLTSIYRQALTAELKEQPEEGAPASPLRSTRS
jgi:hypothetical protein